MEKYAQARALPQRAGPMAQSPGQPGEAESTFPTGRKRELRVPADGRVAGGGVPRQPETLLAQAAVCGYSAGQ